MSNKIEFELEMKFEVPEHEISAYTLVGTSSQLIVMLEELNHYILPDSDVQIYALPYESGSFCKKLKIYATKHVLTPFVENASKQLGTAVVIGFGLLIYGSTKTDSEQIIINNTGGLVQIYTDETIEELKNNKRFSVARSKYFQTLEEDEQVKKVSFRSDKAIVDVPRPAFNQNVIREEIITELQETEIKELTVVSPVLERIKKQWVFNMDGSVRSFSMLDKNFLNDVENESIQFKHGDKIEAIIQAVYKIEKEEKKIKKLNILRVKKFNGRILGNQMEFEFEQ